MSSDTTYPPSSAMAAGTHADKTKYDEMYAQSISDPEGFWREHGQRVDWMKPYSKVKDVSFAPGNISINWFEDGSLNVAANCIDRHLAERGDQTAIIWEPDNPNDDAKHITYKELHHDVCKFSNVLKELGVGKDGLQQGGIPVEMTNPDESQTVDVRGTKRMRPDKKPVKATWY